MRDVVVSLVVGGVVGVVFAVCRLPVPAPPSAAGVAGVAGITLGWWLVRHYTGS